MSLDILLYQAKAKYSSEVQSNLRAEEAVKIKANVNKLFKGYVDRNIGKIEGFNVVYPNLLVKFLEPTRLSTMGGFTVNKDEFDALSGTVSLELDVNMDLSKIIFYSNVGTPNTKKGLHESKYVCKRNDLVVIDIYSTDEEINQAIDNAMVSMLKDYLEI